MKENTKYLINNYNNMGNIVDWMMHLNNFFGEEQTDRFCEYFINAHRIISKSDIRSLIPTYTLSVYWAMQNEQLAFISIYNLINTENELVKNKGIEEIQKFYKNKEQQFLKKVKKLGYSYTSIEGNWKDKKQKDTYQRAKIYAIFSEKDEPQKFINNMCILAKNSNKSIILITDKIKDNSPRARIGASLYNTQTQGIIKEYENLDIKTLEKYFSELSNTKFLFKIPYENNKKILSLEKEKTITSYYSKEKQEKIKKARPQSFNMAMLKSSLENSFLKQTYNE